MFINFTLVAQSESSLSAESTWIKEPLEDFLASHKQGKI